MPRPTREQVEATLATLPPEQHAGFLAEVERRLKAPDVGGTEGMKTVPFMPTKFPSPARPYDAAADALNLTELLPAAGGTVGGALGNAPGAALGSATGEAARQLIRRAAGEPAATGLLQRKFGLDPSGSGAAALGIGAEAALGGTAEKLAQAMKWAGQNLTDWARKSRWGLLSKGATAADEARGLELADRLESEDIAPAFSSRAEQVSRAERALSSADDARRAVEAAHEGDLVNTESVLDRASGQIPRKLPGGEVPRTGRPQRGAAERVADDVQTAIEGMGGGGYDVPLPAAQSEKRRWDALLQSFYETGKVTPSAAQAPTKGAADAWRAAIADQYPDLGAANLRESELIDIARLLRSAQQAEMLGTRSQAGQAAAAVGAGAVGRMSIPAAFAARMGLTGPRALSLSAAGKDLLGRLLVAGAPEQQAFIRMAQFATFDPEAIRRRREAERLMNQGKGVTTP